MVGADRSRDQIGGEMACLGDTPYLRWGTGHGCGNRHGWGARHGWGRIQCQIVDSGWDTR